MDLAVSIHGDQNMDWRRHGSLSVLRVNVIYSKYRYTLNIRISNKRGRIDFETAGRHQGVRKSLERHAVICLPRTRLGGVEQPDFTPPSRVREENQRRDRQFPSTQSSNQPSCRQQLSISSFGSSSRTNPDLKLASLPLLLKQRPYREGARTIQGCVSKDGFRSEAAVRY